MKKKNLISLAAAGLMSLTFAASAFAAPATVERSVNFRSAPSTDSTVYQLLRTGTVIDVQQQVNRYWLKVSVNGKVGYVSPYYISYTQPTSAPAPTATTTAGKVIAHAKSLTGVTRYKYGVNQAPTLMDCSAFTKYVFGKAGIQLKWGTRYQKYAGKFVSKSQLAPGDLIFFRVGSSSSIGHVGIYLGNNQMIHHSPSQNVGISPINTGYWSTRYVTARRVL